MFYKEVPLPSYSNNPASSISTTPPIYPPHYTPEIKSVVKSMTSHKRPIILSPKETYLDDPSDEDDSEWEGITKDPVKRVAFERKCIEDELTDEERVILLQENPSSRSHCRFWDCVPRKPNGEPNIRSAFRFNVKDLSGRYYGKSSHFRKHLS